MISGGGHTSIPTLELLTLEAAAAPEALSMPQKEHLKLNPVRSDLNKKYVY